MPKLEHEGLVVNRGCSPATPCGGCDACGLGLALWARKNLAVHYRNKLADKVGACLRTADAHGVTHQLLGANHYPKKGGEKWCAEGDVGLALGRLAMGLGHWPANRTWYVVATGEPGRIFDINGSIGDAAEPPPTLHFCAGCRQHYDGHPSTRQDTRYVTAGFDDHDQLVAVEVHSHPEMMDRWRGVQPPIPSAPPLYAEPAA